VQFKIVVRSDGSVVNYEPSRKDTLRVPQNQTVSFIAKFDDVGSAVNPYMYHCHMTNHEDAGLMGQFLVQ
jgi:blue copper oxidase